MLAKFANGPVLAQRSPMPTRNVNLTKEMDRFIVKSVKSGNYANASEVMRSA